MLSSQACIIYLSLHYKAVLARYICSPYFSVISNFYVLPISISIPLKKKLSFSSNLLFPLTHVIFSVVKSELHMFACARNMLFFLHEKLYDWRGLYFIWYINMTDCDRLCVHSGSQYFNMTVICFWYNDISNWKIGSIHWKQQMLRMSDTILDCF
jgi:hypothetical protein